MCLFYDDDDDDDDVCIVYRDDVMKRFVPDEQLRSEMT